MRGGVSKHVEPLAAAKGVAPALCVGAAGVVPVEQVVAPSLVAAV